MVKHTFTFLVLLGLAAMMLAFAMDFNGNAALNEVASHYAEKGHEEVGAANLVAAVLVTYRGLDTLGEVTILFLSASIVGFFLKVQVQDLKNRSVTQSSEILQTASKVLAPAIFLLGVYVFLNGHLTPGGGFQGGAIIASGLVLMLLGNPNMQVNHKIISVLESISGFAFVFIGILGVLMAGGFLDNSIMDLGAFGTLLSAGAVPVIYIFIGLKVGAELSNIVSNMQETQNEA